jgi:hypothetical protein
MYSCLEESILNAKAQDKLIADNKMLLEALQEFIACGENAGHNEALKAQALAAITKATN